MRLGRKGRRRVKGRTKEAEGRAAKAREVEEITVQSGHGPKVAVQGTKPLFCKIE